jgi:hypothetical protein
MWFFVDWLTAQPGGKVGQVGNCNNVESGYQSSFCCLTARYYEYRKSGSVRCQRGNEHASHWTYCPVQSQLAHCCDIVALRHMVLRRKNGGSDTEVQASAALMDRCRRQPHGDTPLTRPRKFAVVYRGAHSVACFTHCRVTESDDAHTG